MKPDQQPELPLNRPAPQRSSLPSPGRKVAPPASGWQPLHRHTWFGTITRLMLMAIVLAMVVIPFTPFASKIKNSVTELIERSRKDRIVIQEKPVLKEVIKVLPAPPPPLPSKFVPRKDVDVATLFNGITFDFKLFST